jgi:hypothetical protein
MTKNSSSFRLWVQQIWYENTEERLTFHEKSYTINEYWNKYKYWLKREYQHQHGKEKTTKDS